MQEQTNNNKSVAKSTIAMSFATIFCRITGLLRTWMMAFALGNTVITSAYQVANNMPNVIFEFVAGGLLGAAFIPIFMLEKEKYGKDGGNKFSCNILNITILILGILSVVATVFAPQIIATQTFTVDNTAQVTETSILFFRIFAFQILFYGISAVLTGILNGERVYFMPAFAPALNNVIVIASFVAYAVISPQNQKLAIIILAVGTTLGVAVQAITQIPSLIKSGFKWKPILNFKDPALIAAIKIAIPTFIYVVGTLVAFSCRNAFSLAVGDNGPATIMYAWTWYQLPHGIIAVSLSRTMFTEMSDSAAKNDNKNLKRQINMGLSTTFILILPMAILMSVLAMPIMSIFKAGNFNANDVTYVAQILSVWVISLPFYSVLMYLYNVYAAIKKFHVFAAVSTIAVVLQCFMYWSFTQIEQIALMGIPIADFIYFTLCCIILLFILRKLIKNYSFIPILKNGLKIILACLIGFAVCCLLSSLIKFGDPSIINGIIEIAVSGGISLIVIFFIALIFKVDEIKRLFDIVVNKIKRK